MNHIRITYVLLLQIRCKCDAKREDRTERRYTDMRYIGISRDRDIERPGYREIGRPRDRETEILGDRDIGRPRYWETESRNPPVDGKQITG
jgi:hypothetical protein